MIFKSICKVIYSLFVVIPAICISFICYLIICFFEDDISWQSGVEVHKQMLLDSFKREGWNKCKDGIFLDERRDSDKLMQVISSIRKGA